MTGILAATDDDLSDFTVEIADQVETFVLATREIAAAEDPDLAISLLVDDDTPMTVDGRRVDLRRARWNGR